MTKPNRRLASGFWLSYSFRFRHSSFATDLRQPGRDSDRLVQASRVGQAFPRDVEGGAVINRGAHNRQAESEVHASVEGKHFEGDVALIVIESHDRIESFAYSGGASG